MRRRAAWVEVDHDALSHNVATLASMARPARLCAVVKADGYGHGAVEVAATALDAGASWLAVALVEEAATLRRAGIDAPLLLLSQPPVEEIDEGIRLDLRWPVYTAPFADALVAAVGRAGVAPVPVHLKVDTGMHRVGVAPGAAADLAASIAARGELVLEGLWTHCAVADEPGNAFTGVQADRLEAVRGELSARDIDPPLVHAANSAATIDHPRLHHDLVRCGIAVYGLDPSPALAGRAALRPALSLKASVAHVQVVPAGDAVSYGLRHGFEVDSVVATLPLGYADGVTRRLSRVGGEVLLRGRPRPMVGTITMDQLLVDCGPASDPASEVAVGDEAVLIGEQCGRTVGADDWAARLDTISYEIVCGISSRVPRVHRGGGR